MEGCLGSSECKVGGGGLQGGGRDGEEAKGWSEREQRAAPEAAAAAGSNWYTSQLQLNRTRTHTHTQGAQLQVQILPSGLDGGTGWGSDP